MAQLFICLRPNDILSLSFDSISDTSTDVLRILECKTRCLHLTLARRIRWLVSKEVDVPLTPKRGPTRAVVDSPRSLSHVRNFNIYVPKLQVSSKVPAFTQAIKQARKEPQHHDEDLSSLFNGTGAMEVDFYIASLANESPSYGFIESP